MKRLLVLLAAYGAARPAADDKPVDKTVQLNANGALVHVEDAVVPGYVTIVDFWSTSCQAC
ncbi:MAG TPA: hypothetical protein VIV40_32145, partial [Kofleriaceae bacterium]